MQQNAPNGDFYYRCPECNHWAHHHIVCRDCDKGAHALCTAQVRHPKDPIKWSQCHCDWNPDFVIVDKDILAAVHALNLAHLPEHDEDCSQNDYTIYPEVWDGCETGSVGMTGMPQNREETPLPGEFSAREGLGRGLGLIAQQRATLKVEQSNAKRPVSIDDALGAAAEGLLGKI